MMDINESWKQWDKTKEMLRNGFGEDLIVKNIMMKCNVRCLERWISGWCIVDKLVEF
jgi:hypothetical protein